MVWRGSWDSLQAGGPRLPLLASSSGTTALLRGSQGATWRERVVAFPSPSGTKEQNPAISQPKAGCQESLSLFLSVRCSVYVISVCPGNTHAFMLSVHPQSMYIHGDVCVFGLCVCVCVVTGVYVLGLHPHANITATHNNCRHTSTTDRYSSCTYKMTMDIHFHTHAQTH